MDKDALILHVFKIFEMGLAELDAHALNISLSEIDDKAKEFLNRAIELRVEELTARQGDATMVVCSELDGDDI